MALFSISPLASIGLKELEIERGKLFFLLELH
jgi:hypothetical protein